MTAEVRDRAEQIKSVSRDHNDAIEKLRNHVTQLTEDITDFQLQLDVQEPFQRDHRIKITNIWLDSGDVNLIHKTVNLSIISANQVVHLVL